MKAGFPLALIAVAALLISMFLPNGWNTMATTQESSVSEGIDFRFWVSVVVSLVILAAGLFIILSKKYAAEDRNWAFGAVGTVVGFWLPIATQVTP